MAEISSWYRMLSSLLLALVDWCKAVNRSVKCKCNVNYSLFMQASQAHAWLPKPTYGSLRPGCISHTRHTEGQHDFFTIVNSGHPSVYSLLSIYRSRRGGRLVDRTRVRQTQGARNQATRGCIFSATQTDCILTLMANWIRLHVTWLLIHTSCTTNQLGPCSTPEWHSRSRSLFLWDQ